MVVTELIPILAVLTLLPFMLVLMVAGERMARRTDKIQAAPIDAAVLALLGLLFGFQFAGASNRLEARRAIVVKEANTIGSAYILIDILPAEDQPALRDLFRTYTSLRIQMVESGGINNALAADVESRKLQTQIWKKAVAACKKDPSPATTTLVLSALSEMYNITNQRYVASHTHTPVTIVALLFGLTIVCSFLVGYTTNDLRHSWVLRGLFATVILSTMYVTLDLEFPRVGLIRVGAADDAMLATRRGMD